MRGRSLLRVLNWSTRQNQVITSEASEKVNSLAVNLISRWLANATWRRAVFLQKLSSFHLLHSSWLCFFFLGLGSPCSSHRCNQNGILSTELHLKTCFHCTAWCDLSAASCTLPRLSFLFLSPNNIICFVRQRYVFYKVNQKNTCDSVVFVLQSLWIRIKSHPSVIG